MFQIFNKGNYSLNTFIVLFSLYLFFLPIPHTAAMKNIFLVLSFSFFIYLLIKKLISVNVRNILFVLIILFLMESIISILINQIEVSQSFRAIRQTLFEQIYIFVVVVSVFNTKNKLEYLIYVLITSFGILTILSLFEVIQFSFFAQLDLTTETQKRLKYYSGYALKASFYLSISIGYFIYKYQQLSVIQKVIYSILLFTSLLLTINYESDAVIYTLCLTTLLTIIIKFRSKIQYSIKNFVLILCLFIALILIVVNISGKPLSAFDITEESAFSGRVGIWKVELNCIKDSLILGYGFGWKKNYEVCSQQKYVDFINKNIKLDYIRTFFLESNRDKLNPHNLYIQILLTNGVLGLLVLLTIIGISVYYLIKSKSNLAIIVFLPVVFAYLLNNTMNGLFEGEVGKVLFIVIAGSLVLYKLSKDEQALFSSSQ